VPASRPAPGLRPWSEWVVDGACVAFGLWTLASQAVVVLGGSLITLLQVAGTVTVAVSVGIAIGLSRGSFRRSARATEDDQADGRAACGESSIPSRFAMDRAAPLLRGAVLLVAVVAVPVFRDRPEILWWIVAGCLAAGAIVSFTGGTPGTGRPARHETLLFALAAACAVYALICHRPDADDAFYINVAAAAVDVVRVWWSSMRISSSSVLRRSLEARLNSDKLLPMDRPSSGSLRGPKMISAMTKMIISSGIPIEPNIMLLLALFAVAAAPATRAAGVGQSSRHEGWH